MISIIIPVYNEHQRIPRTLKKVTEFIKKTELISEVIFVDDGSIDDTAALIEAAASINPLIKIIRQTKNTGKGAAIKKGVLGARLSDYVLYTDTDLSTPLEELPRLLSKRENADVIIGSRYMRDSTLDIGQSQRRHFISTVFNIIRRCILLPSIHDSQCGFKIFTYAAAQKIFPLQTLSGFAFDMELLAIAKEQHLSIKEIGVIWTDDNKGKLRVIPTSLRMLRDMIKIRANVFFGKYKSNK